MWQWHCNARYRIMWKYCDVKKFQTLVMGDPDISSHKSCSCSSFTSISFSGGNCWTEEMQWWCKCGYCKPFCQKPFRRIQQEEISEFSVNFLIDHKYLSLWSTNHLITDTSRMITNDQLLGLHLDQCTYHSSLMTLALLFYAYSELCHQNITTDSGKIAS